LGLQVLRVRRERLLQRGDRLLALALLEQREPEGIQEFHVLGLDCQTPLVGPDGAGVVAGPFVGHARSQKRVGVEEPLLDLRDRVGGQRDELRDVGGAVGPGEALEQHGGRGVPVRIDVGQEELSIRSVDLRREDEPAAVG